MTQAMTVADETRALTIPEGGWADDGTSDIEPALPIIQIIQPMTQAEGAVAGFFLHSDTGEMTGNLVCVPLVRHQQRALFTKGDDKPLCRSNDSIMPAPGVRLWTPEYMGRKHMLGNRERMVPELDNGPQNCASCPFSQWGGQFGDEPPACGLSYVITVARNGDPNDLALLRIKGTSIKPYKDWVRKKVLPRRLPQFAFELDLTTEEHTKPGMKWYQLVVRAKELPEPEIYEWDNLVRQFRSRIEKAIQDAGGEVAEWAEDMPFE